MFNGSQPKTFAEVVSPSTRIKPPKIHHWSANMEAKLKRLFSKEKRSIHAIARMLGAREYEVADKLKEMNIPTEKIVLNRRPSPMKGYSRKDYIPKWVRAEKGELVLAPEPEPAPTPAPVHEPIAVEGDPRVLVLELFVGEKDRFRQEMKKLAEVDPSTLNSRERVLHDIAYLKAVTMHDWFSRNYDMLVTDLATSMHGGPNGREKNQNVGE